MSRTSIDAFEPVVQALCERLDTPRALSVWLCYKYDHEALLQLPQTDFAGSTAEVGKNYLITEFLSKYKGLKVKVDTAAVALQKWILSEQKCAETNAKLRDLRIRPSHVSGLGRVDGLLFEAQRKICQVLGRLNLPIVLADCKWGPGATLDLKREDATPDKKMTSLISCTAAAAPYLKAVLEADPHWMEAIAGIHPSGRYSVTKHCVSIVRGSRFLTVPKSAKTDRCIAAEPTGNSFLQQGVHSYMRRRLKRFGVDLDDQSINQRLARMAFANGLSTLDLSAASDSISTELVYHLLPLDWAVFLDALRSPESRVNGTWIKTEKFASMGNAFCFELESLIFWALAASVEEAVCGNVCWTSVYGDDIIVPRNCFREVVNLLEFCGFTVNESKSFEDGNFFESCGKHYHRGVDITPVYQKELVTAPPDIIRTHNRLYRWANRVSFCDGMLVTGSARRKLRESYSWRPIPCIPFGVDEDGGFLQSVDLFTADPNHGFRCRVLDYVPQYTEAHETAMYAYKLRRLARRNPLQKGHAANSTKGTWRVKTRWIPMSAVIQEVASICHLRLIGLA